MQNMELSADAKIVPLPTADIGGTNAAAVAASTWGAWHDMAGFDRITAVVQLGTWNSSDDLDECRLQQATSNAGAGAKDLTTDASGGDYDTDTPVDAAGDQVIIEAKADQLDVDNGFQFVRVYAAEGGNTGTDEVFGVLILHAAREKHAEKHGAAVAGSIVYVRT